MDKLSFDHWIQDMDNHPGILEFRFADGSAIWPALRFELRLKYMERQAARANSGGYKGETAAGRGKSDMLRYMWHCLRYAPLLGYRNLDVLSLANYEGDPACPNRMTVFLKSLPQIKSRELLYSPRWLTFSGIANTGSFDYFFFRAMLESKIATAFRKKNTETESDILYEILSRGSVDFFGEQELHSAINSLLRQNKYTVKYRKLASRFLKKNRPGLILCSEGNNGDWRHAIWFSAASELGVPTAEVQHGIFNLGMKYGSEIVKEPLFAKQKSRYLFTFGPFHCRQTNLPAKCIALGHYHLEQQAGKWPERNRKSGEPLSIVFVCEGIPPSSENNGLINTVLETLKSLDIPFRVIVRLHPSEKEDDKYGAFFKFPGTRYSAFRDENIHGLINSADVVISHASTVVFEALYFKKPVFVLEDGVTPRYIPHGTGSWFKNAAELQMLLTQVYSFNYQLPEDHNDYWARGSVHENFMKFWKEEINGSRANT